MNEPITLVCPTCSGSNLLIKYEATYIYSYIIDRDAPGLKNGAEFLPFLYDNREQKETKQYLECTNCGTKYPCYYDHWDSKIGIKELQNTIQNNDDSTITNRIY